MVIVPQARANSMMRTRNPPFHQVVLGDPDRLDRLGWAAVGDEDHLDPGVVLLVDRVGQADDLGRTVGDGNDDADQRLDHCQRGAVSQVEAHRIGAGQARRLEQAVGDSIPHRGTGRSRTGRASPGPRARTRLRRKRNRDKVDFRCVRRADRVVADLEFGPAIKPAWLGIVDSTRRSLIEGRVDPSGEILVGPRRESQAERQSPAAAGEAPRGTRAARHPRRGSTEMQPRTFRAISQSSAGANGSSTPPAAKTIRFLLIR